MSEHRIQADAIKPSAIKIYNMNDYTDKTLRSDIKQFVGGGSIKTGYAGIDRQADLHPGLYVIGAISSLGKTTFIHQMCDQIAETGEKVIYFSLEQSTLELASKSLARIMAKQDASTAMSSLQIRMGGGGERLKSAIDEYSRFSENITVAECSFRATIDDIETYVQTFIATQQVRPVVVVDYLQVIQASPESRLSTKDLVDRHVRRLKQLQSDYNLILIIISSLNRQNYLTQVDYESFKESGGIEYTSDVIWGLQLEVLTDPVFDKQGSINEKREKVREAKASNPRKIELVCLKNRFGISSYRCKFNYFPAYDLFQDDDQERFVPFTDSEVPLFL